MTGASPDGRAFETVPRRPPGTPAPLTPAQSRIWVLDRSGYGGSAYLCWTSRRYRGPLDAGALTRALHALVARHEALRTAVEVTAAGPVQVVSAAESLVDGLVEVGDLAHLPDAESAARRLTEAFVARPMRLDRPPLHRALLLRLAPDDHVLVWCLHHIVCDGHSLGLLEEELFALYRGAELGPVAVQFPDYAAWLAGRAAGHGEEYWRTRLHGAPAVQSLPSDRARPAEPSTRGAHRGVRLPADLSRAVLDVARRERCTPFVLFLTAMAAVLSRHSGERDVVVGTPASDRDLPDLERSIGFYVNTLPIRADLTGDPTLRELLRQVRSTVFGALEHRAVPFDEIVRVSGTTRDPARNPLFQTLLVMDPGTPATVDGDLTGEAWSLPAGTSRVDLTLLVTTGEQVELWCDYAADLFTTAQVDRFRDHLVRLVEAMVADLDQRLSAVALLDDRERAELVGAPVDPGPGETGPGASGPDRAPVVRLFTELAATQPDAPALVTAERTVTYRELDELTDAVAAELSGAALVGVVLPTGVEAVVAVLGALKAGAAYLPLSPADPAGRTDELLRVAGADHVVTGRGVSRRSGPGTHEGPSAATAAAGAHPDRAHDLAYVIFTSGSTGRPKGVLVGHRTLARFTESFRRVHRFGPGQRILMLPPLTFDASVGDLFPALTSGAALVLHPEPARLDATELVAFCARHRVSAVDAPAALWRRWADDLDAGVARVPRDWPVTTMMVGGERVSRAALASWGESTGRRVAFFNHYGPTEATVCATVHETVDGSAPGDGDGPHLPIGRPLPHVRAYVLDATGALAPLGAPGELHLGGDCLALGYLGEPGPTRESFVPDPFHGGRMYRTGDLARRRADGTLEFLGRVDRQVKIRGHRIEPAEVESAMTDHPDVRDAAVVAVGERLVAYTETEATPVELRRFVRDRVPRHLVPDRFVVVDRIARTAHGKVDLASLPPAPPETRTHTPPDGPVETALAAIWSAVLEVPRVGRADNFLDLGGSSLVAARVAAAIERDLGRTVPLSVLLECDDLADLARSVAAAPATGGNGTGGNGTGTNGTGTNGTGTNGNGTNGTGTVRTVVTEPDLLADTLPAEVAGAAPPRPPSSVATVLVTGATGFLGAHVVDALLATTGATVVCLVRAPSPNAARDRVLRNLRAYGLDGDPGRIVGLPGDLAEPRFGLAEPAWRELARRCDVLCHNGGLVHFAAPYAQLREANVVGTVEVLRLAALGGARVHAVSTLGVYLGTAHRGTRVTERDEPGGPDGLPGAYEQSKWVADRLCREARAAGLAVSVHRPARVSGHSRTGRCNPEDYLNRLLTTFVQTGCVPDMAHTEDLAPVDHVAAGIVGLLSRPAGPDYHYFNPATLSYPELAGALADHGYPVRLVPWARWRDEVNGRLAAGAPLALAPFITRLPEQEPSFPRPEFDCTATERAVGPCPPADRGLVRRYLSFLATTGAVPQGAVT